jgi:hypothetical protein
MQPYSQINYNLVALVQAIECVYVCLYNAYLIGLFIYLFILV